MNVPRVQISGGLGVKPLIKPLAIPPRPFGGVYPGEKKIAVNMWCPKYRRMGDHGTAAGSQERPTNRRYNSDEIVATCVEGITNILVVVCVALKVRGA